MENKRIKAVLWDMDGTLFNTKRGIEKALNDACTELSFPPIAPEAVETFIGPPIQFGFRDYYNLPLDRAIYCAGVFRKYYREKDYVLECDPYDGLTESLRELKGKGFFLGVCTLKKQDMAERIVEKYGMAELFDSVVGTDADDHIKKEDTITLSCEKWGIETGEAVLVGDTEFDPLGAEKAGSLFIGVTYGFGFKTKEDVDDYRNIGTALSPEEVCHIIYTYNKEAV